MGCTSSSAAAADGESWPAEEPLPPRPRSPHRVPHPAHAPGSPAPAPPLVASRSLGRRSAPLPPPPPPPPPPQPPSEKVSAATLDRLRSTFLTTATRGSVYDYYTLGHTLGTGGYAVVKLGTQKQSGRKVAIKIMRLPEGGTLRGMYAMHQAKAPSMPGAHASGGMGSIDANKSIVESAEIDEEDVFKEIEILKSLDHPAVLKMLEYFIAGSRDKVYIVTELLKGGELLEALLERGAYSERDARTIFRPILEGIAYLHAKRITHRDLKLENLLLADKGDLSSVRIADFGLAKAVFDSSDDPHAMRAVCGTPAYVAPEIITRRVYTPAVDLWSAGVILYILLSGVVPFEDQDEKRLFAKISRGAYSLNGPEWVAVSSEAKRLVAGLMCLDPARRLTAAAALEHNWFLRASRKLPPSVTPSQKEMDDAKEEEAAAVPLPSAAGGLAAFAARIKLPVQQFPAGSHIIHRGERATHVYLIRSGTCALVLEPEAHEEPQPHEGGSTPDDLGQGVKLLGRRGAGDFVGETGVVMDARGRLILPRSAAGETGAGGGLLDSPGPVTPKSPPSPHAGEPSGGDKWMAALMARKVAKKWVGSRRSVSVVAETDVEAVLLRKREMQWVLDNDASMQEEVRLAVERRQGELVARGVAAPEAAASLLASQSRPLHVLPRGGSPT